MLVSQRSLVFLCLVFLTFGYLTSGLTCYDCVTCTNVGGDTVTTTVSDSAGYSCYKVTTSVGSTTTVSRGVTLSCASNGAAESISCCITDRCNTGSLLSSSSGFAYLAIVSGIILRARSIG